MPPQKSQSNINPNQAAASLAFATQLSERMMPQAPVEAPTEPQSAPPQEQSSETQKSPAPEQDQGARIAELELSITKKLDEIRQELKGDAKAQIDSLKKDIELALQDEQPQ